MDTKNVIATLSQNLLDEVKKIMKKEKSEKGETDADEKREHCSEALKGDQHKIDANKNGKVDAHDFKLLRKKNVKEEAEDVEEGVKEPYAVGMAAAMKATGDTPPLKKSTIMKAHKIAKKIKEGYVPTSDEPTEANKKTADKVRALLAKEKKPVKEELDDALEAELKAQRQTKKSVADAKKKYGVKEEVELEEGENKTGLPKSTAEKNKQYIEITHLLGHKKRVPVHPTNAYKALNHYRGLASTKSARIVSEEVEQLDELSKATMGRYINKAATKIGTQGITAGLKIASDENSKKNFKDMGKREKGIARAVNKLTKEEQEFIDSLNKELFDEIEITEARGRPPKEGSEAWKKRQAEGAAAADEPRQHPIQQLERIKRDMRGGGDFLHKDGSTHHLKGGDAAKLLDKYHGLKPAEKEDMQREIHGSHAGLKKHL